jgi:hypothetical protein
MAQPDMGRYGRSTKGSKKRLVQLQRQAWSERRMWLVLAIGMASLGIYLGFLWYFNFV